MVDEEVERSSRRGAGVVLAMALGAVVAASVTPAVSGSYLPAKVKYIKGPDTQIAADGNSHMTNGAICPDGWNVVGGGVIGSTLFRLVHSFPTKANGTDWGRRGWTVEVVNTFGGGGSANGNAVAICVKGATTSGNWP